MNKLLKTLPEGSFLPLKIWENLPFENVDIDYNCDHPAGNIIDPAI